VRLLRLPGEVKAALLEDQISEGHARALLAAKSNEMMIRLLKKVIGQNLNVRQTEELVRRSIAESQAKPKLPPPSPDTVALEKHFREALGTKVRLFRSKKGGKLVINFYSEEELQAIYDIIVGPESS